MTNPITKVLAFIGQELNDNKYAIAGQALTLFMLSLAFPTAIQIGGNPVVSSLVAAIFVLGSLMGAVPITFTLFDYTKEGEYKLSLKQLSLTDKLFIFSSTMVFAALGLQFMSMLFPTVISFASTFTAIGITTYCEIVWLGSVRLEDLFTETEDDSGIIRQGKRKPTQPKGK